MITETNTFLFIYFFFSFDKFYSFSEVVCSLINRTFVMFCVLNQQNYWVINRFIPIWTISFICVLILSRNQSIRTVALIGVVDLLVRALERENPFIFQQFDYFFSGA